MPNIWEQHTLLLYKNGNLSVSEYTFVYHVSSITPSNGLTPEISNFDGSFSL